MSADPDTVPVPDRRLVDVSLARRLIARQFPQRADLPVRPVASSGWDNQTFHLGDRLSVRLPTAREYALAVDKEHRWLPVLAPQLPVPVPVPVAKGEPDEGFAFPWSVYEWIDGDPASVEVIGDLCGFADNPQARRAIEVLGDRVPRDTVTQIWTSALDAAWDGRPVWFHGDVAPGNLLVRDGALAAVIDFGTCGVGDPACDVAIAWMFFSGAGRDAFRARLNADPGTWARGRGWALWKALIVYAGALSGDQAAARWAKRILDQVLTEFAESA